MKKLILLIPILLMLSGCYDYVEIDDISIITGIILDYKDNKYELTSEVLENEKESKVTIYKTSCYDIDSCLLQISKESNKDLFISHLKALILTDRTVNKNINFYDYFIRSSKSKMNYYVYYVSDEYKDKIFNTLEENENTSLFLKDMTEFNVKYYSSSIKLKFIDMIQKLSEKGIDNIYPSISIKEDKLYLDSLVSFDKNNNKIELSNNESIFYNILADNMITTDISIPCDNNTFSLNLNYLKIKYKINNDLDIDIKLDAKLSNYNCKYDLEKNDTIVKLEKLASNYIKNNSNDLIKLSKEKNTDFLGLENYIYKHSKKNKKIKDINTKVNVDLKIISIGESRK